MNLSDSRGIKTSQWSPNEILRNDDINIVGQSQYQNITDLLAIVAKRGLVSGVDVVIGGLELEHDTLLTCTLYSGAAVSSQGAYLNSGTWGFVADTDNVFSVFLPEDISVAFNTGGVQDRIDSVEIRPIENEFNSVSRTFKDPVTGLTSTSVVKTRKEYGYELAVREGTEAGSPVAPSRTSGWVKLAEVYVAAGVSSITDSEITTFIESDSWTTDSEATQERISTDGTLSRDRDTVVPTEKAVKTYVESYADTNDETTKTELKAANNTWTGENVFSGGILRSSVAYVTLHTTNTASSQNALFDALSPYVPDGSDIVVSGYAAYRAEDYLGTTGRWITQGIAVSRITRTGNQIVLYGLGSRQLEDGGLLAPSLFFIDTITVTNGSGSAWVMDSLSGDASPFENWVSITF